MDFRNGGYGGVENVWDEGIVESYVVGVLLSRGECFVVGWLWRGTVRGVGKRCYVGLARAGGNVKGCFADKVSDCGGGLMNGRARDEMKEPGGELTGQIDIERHDYGSSRIASSSCLNGGERCSIHGEKA